MEGLTEGRIVHYVMPDGRSAAECRPGLVVKVWRDGNGSPPGNGVCNLQVFTDGMNDGPAYITGIAWKTSVVYSAEGAPGTWHWPERNTNTEGN